MSDTSKYRMLFLGPEEPQIVQLKADFEEKNLQVEMHNTLDFEEANTIMLNRSPLVVVSTDIILITKLMMKNKNFLKTSATKTILYNNRGPIPKDLNDKLNECGLSGELTEKSSAKTIYYKATLFLKALPDPEDGDDVIYDGSSNYDPKDNKKKIAYIKEIKKNGDGEVELETSNGLVENVVLQEFCDESIGLLKDMEKIIEQIEDKEIPFNRITEYTDYVNGIMGTSSVLGLEGISSFCQLTKIISEHILHYEQPELRDVVIGVLGDSNSFLTNLMGEIRVGDESTMKNIGKEGFIKRLTWLSDKFKLTGDDQNEEDAPEMDQSAIDALLESML